MPTQILQSVARACAQSWRLCLDFVWHRVGSGAGWRRWMTLMTQPISGTKRDNAQCIHSPYKLNLCVCVCITSVCLHIPLYARRMQVHKVSRTFRRALRRHSQTMSPERRKNFDINLNATDVGVGGCHILSFELRGGILHGSHLVGSVRVFVLLLSVCLRFSTAENYIKPV